MNSQTAFMTGVGVLFCTIAANRFLGERNYKQLSPADKIKLVDQFSGHRSLATYLPLGIMGLVILVGRSNPGMFRWLFPIAVAAALGVSITLQTVVLRRLTTLGLPGDFVSRFRFQSIAVQVGNVIALSLLVYGIVGAT